MIQASYLLMQRTPTHRCLGEWNEPAPAMRTLRKMQRLWPDDEFYVKVSR